MGDYYRPTLGPEDHPDDIYWPNPPPVEVSRTLASAVAEHAPAMPLVELTLRDGTTIHGDVASYEPQHGLLVLEDADARERPVQLADVAAVEVCDAA